MVVNCLMVFRVMMVKIVKIMLLYKIKIHNKIIYFTNIGLYD